MFPSDSCRLNPLCKGSELRPSTPAPLAGFAWKKSARLLGLISSTAGKQKGRNPGSRPAILSEGMANYVSPAEPRCPSANVLTRRWGSAVLSQSSLFHSTLLLVVHLLRLHFLAVDLRFGVHRHSLIVRPKGSPDGTDFRSALLQHPCHLVSTRSL